MNKLLSLKYFVLLFIIFIKIQFIYSNSKEIKVSDIQKFKSSLERYVIKKVLGTKDHFLYMKRYGFYKERPDLKRLFESKGYDYKSPDNQNIFKNRDKKDQYLAIHISQLLSASLYLESLLEYKSKF